MRRYQHAEQLQQAILNYASFYQLDTEFLEDVMITLTCTLAVRNSRSFTPFLNRVKGEFVLCVEESNGINRK